jgi:hypothetical protein
MAAPQSTVVYKDVPGFPGYRVGDDGSVWSCLTRKGSKFAGPRVIGDKWHRLTISVHPKTGRCRVILRKKHFAVYRLVLTAFVGPCPPGMEACHFPDRDTRNNRLCNLRWDTKAANQADRELQGTVFRGSRHGNAKLTEEQVVVIRRRHVQGETKAQLAREYRVTPRVIHLIVTRQAWRHVQ